LDKVELLLAFEKTFNIEMPESEIKEFFLVQDAITYVKEYTKRN